MKMRGDSVRWVPLALVLIGVIMMIVGWVSGPRIGWLSWAGMVVYLVGAVLSISLDRNTPKSSEPAAGVVIDLNAEEAAVIRRARAEGGRIAAVRRMRELRPELSLAEAVRVVDGL